MSIKHAMTMTQKIIAAHCKEEYVTPGQLVMADVDFILGNDITAPVAIKEFNKLENKTVFDKDKIAIVLDHFIPNKDIKAAAQSTCCRNFAKEYDITHFYDVGEMGIEHALLPEKGLCAPGELIIGADSHTCTYGAVGAFSTGVGSTDLAYAIKTGKVWLKVPSAIKINLSGKLSPYVTGKDLILHIIGITSVDGALYKSLEFVGEGVHSLTVADRLTVANMAIEAGAKNGIFITDENTKEYLSDKVSRKYTAYFPDDNAEYEKTIDINLSQIRQTVAFPHLPSNVHTFDTIGNIPVDQVVIGSCTNGRIEDMRAAAEILKNKKVNKNTRVIIIPATQKVYLQCIKEGLTEIFINAGCIVSTPTCGPCLGGYMGILDKGEKCISTTNRNFIGRMGHKESEVYLASPYVAAASALTGKISSTDEVI